MSHIVWLRKRLLSAGLEPVLRHSHKYHVLHSIFNEKKAKINSSFVSQSLWTLGANITSFNLLNNFSFLYPLKAVYDTMRWKTIIYFFKRKVYILSLYFRRQTETFLFCLFLKSLLIYCTPLNVHKIVYNVHIMHTEAVMNAQQLFLFVLCFGNYTNLTRIYE